MPLRSPKAHPRYLVDYTITTSGFGFSVHTRRQKACLRHASHEPLGVDFTLTQVEPGLWKWRFQIGEAVTTGRAEAKLMGLAAHRVKQRIDRELKKPHDLALMPPDSSVGKSPDAT